MRCVAIHSMGFFETTEVLSLISALVLLLFKYGL
jgi:hypothetical protein